MRTYSGLVVAALGFLPTNVSATALPRPTLIDEKRYLQQLRNGPSLRFLTVPRGGSDPSKLYRRVASDARMPSLFSSDEAIYDKYAACLAATEGLRRIRDRDMMEDIKSTDLLGGNPTEKEEQITREFLRNSKKVLQLMGLSVEQFNELGQQISRDDRLRERVRVRQSSLPHDILKSIQPHRWLIL